MTVPHYVVGDFERVMACRASMRLWWNLPLGVDLRGKLLPRDISQFARILTSLVQANYGGPVVMCPPSYEISRDAREMLAKRVRELQLKEIRSSFEAEGMKGSESARNPRVYGYVPGARGSAGDINYLRPYDQVGAKRAAYVPPPTRATEPT